MSYLSSLTDEEKRRRKLAGALEDGEYVSFDIMLRDGQRATFLTDSATTADAAYQNSVDDLNGWRTVRDGVRAMRYSDLQTPEAQAIAAEAAYQDSKAALNSWRDAPAKAPAPAGGIPFSTLRYL